MKLGHLLAILCLASCSADDLCLAPCASTGLVLTSPAETSGSSSSSEMSETSSSTSSPDRPGDLSDEFSMSSTSDGPMGSTSTGSLPAVCGDGVLEGQEACDDGNLDSSDDCTELCEIAACGDGFVQYKIEECDDANLDDSDSCLSGCTAAVCGDGFVHMGVEPCDDGNNIDADACSQTCELPRLVFVTGLSFAGDLGGLAGADAKCQAAADSYDLGIHPFKAWLSDSTGAPGTRFDTGFGGKYTLVNGTVVAVGWDDLTDGSVKSAIDRTEGNSKREVPVWTNTQAAGTVAGPNSCGQWSTADMDTKGILGISTAVDLKWTIYEVATPCSLSFALYCVEDPLP